METVVDVKVKLPEFQFHKGTIKTDSRCCDVVSPAQISIP